jgi:hypothetical protein
MRKAVGKVVSIASFRRETGDDNPPPPQAAGSNRNPGNRDGDNQYKRRAFIRAFVLTGSMRKAAERSTLPERIGGRVTADLLAELMEQRKAA